MPVCPQCDTAYLDGESHACAPRDSAAMEAINVFGGIVAGAAAAFALVWAVSVPFAQEEGPPIIAFLCAPVGALFGGLSVASAAKRKSNAAPTPRRPKSN